jgi:hypothetical protein
MAKDRFNKFKPINWNSDFKQTGSFLKPENNIINKKKIRTFSQNQLLIDITNLHYTKYNNWEKKFLETINIHQYKLSDKQKNILIQIKEKYEVELSREQLVIWNQIIN